MKAISKILILTTLCATQIFSIKLVNIGQPINTAGHEFAPSLTSDSKTMVFNHSPTGSSYQDLYISYFINNRWTKPRSLVLLNSKYNDETPYISADGNLLIFASDRDGSFEIRDKSRRVKVSFDLYWSKKINGRFSRPTKLPGRVNTKNHERTPSMSKNGKVLFFASFPFGKSKQSVIKASAFRNGIFQEAQSLPAIINSGNQEMGLVEAQDKDGFYFSSRRPGGFGGADLYFVSYSNEKFGKVTNLGKEINSKANDMYLTSMKEKVFLCSDKKSGKGQFDIYSYKVAEQKILTIKVIDKRSKLPIKTLVRLQLIHDANAHQQSLSKHSNDRGLLEIALQADVKKARVQITQKGYLPFVDTLGLYNSKERTIELIPIEDSQSFTVRAIHFAFDSAKIEHRSFPFLNTLAKYIYENKLKMEIIGHTDLNGTANYNAQLSLKRAAAVKKYLISRGLSAGQFQVKGAGMSRPLVSRRGGSYDAKNRRTEFKIIGRVLQ